MVLSYTLNVVSCGPVLGSLQQRLPGSWVVFGDFHAIISNEEKKGGIRPHRSHGKNFTVGWTIVAW